MRGYPVAVVAGLVLFAVPALAAFDTTITKAPGFDPDAITRIAVVTTSCHEVVNCGRIEDLARLEIMRLRQGMSVPPPAIIRPFLMTVGATEYATEHRQALAAEFELDAILELEIPHAEKGQVGQRGSRVKVELRLVSPDGDLLLHGVGTGRPLNAVSSPERAAGNVVELLLAKAFR